MAGWRDYLLNRGMAPTVLDVKSISRLSPTQRRVLGFLQRGLSYKEIASCLDRSMSTVKTHIGIIYHKTGSHSSAEAVFNTYGEQHCAWDVPIMHLPAKRKKK
jgi:DNA-binding CsgD family transcriptional regulator